MLKYKIIKSINGSIEIFKFEIKDLFINESVVSEIIIVIKPVIKIIIL